jgi:hypothetical protein
MPQTSLTHPRWRSRVVRGLIGGIGAFVLAAGPAGPAATGPAVALSDNYDANQAQGSYALVADGPVPVCYPGDPSCVTDEAM